MWRFRSFIISSLYRIHIVYLCIIAIPFSAPLLLNGCASPRAASRPGGEGGGVAAAERTSDAGEERKEPTGGKGHLEAIAAFDEAVAANMKEVEERVQLAVALDRAGRTDEALQVLRAGEARFPNRPEFVFLEGEIDLRAGRIEAAEAAFEEALRIAPDHLPALMSLGMLRLYRKGEPELALPLFERVTEENPEGGEGFRLLGEALLRLDRLDEAVSAFEKALRRAPGNAAAHLSLGDAYLRQGRLDEAEGAFREATRIDPESPAARFRLGFALHEEGRLSEALDAYDRVLALDPDLSIVHLLKANIYAQQGAFGKVLEALVAVLVHNFERSFIPSPRKGGEGVAEKRVGEGIDDKEIRGETEEALRRRLQEARGSSDAHTLLALIAVDRKEPEVARFECQRALSLDPRNPYAHFVMGLLHLNSDEPERALASFTAATAADRDFAPGYLFEGWVHEYRDNLDAAIAAYEKANEARSPAVTLHIGELLLRKGAYREAEEHFRAVLAERPDELRAERGLAIAAFGAQPNARAHWLAQKVLTADPSDALVCFMKGILEVERGEGEVGVATLAHCLSIERKGEIDFGFLLRKARNRQLLYRALVEAGGKARKPVEALLSVAQILTAQEEFPAALQIYDHLVKQLPKNAIVRTLRGNLLLRLHRPKEARSDYEAALRIDPSLAWAERGIGWSAFQEERYEAAEEAFRRALTIERDPVALNGLGEALRRQGRFDEARAAYLSALQLAPDFRLPYLNLGRMERDLGFFGEAIDLYRAYLERYPGDLETRFQLGLVYFYAGRHREAASTWQSLLSREHPRQAYLEILTYFALQYSGEAEAAERLIRERLERSIGGGWPASVIAFLGQRISEVELVAAARDDDTRKEREKLCEAYYYLGAWYRTVRKDPVTARRYFERAVATKVTDFIEYRLARIALGLGLGLEEK